MEFREFKFSTRERSFSKKSHAQTGAGPKKDPRPIRSGCAPTPSRTRNQTGLNSSQDDSYDNCQLAFVNTVAKKCTLHTRNNAATFSITFQYLQRTGVHVIRANTMKVSCDAIVLYLELEKVLFMALTDRINQN